ncbi:hypothetical protein CFS9_28670 [Flavobacterium sp. CFS9]|uniref:Immunity protein 17 n=1 Tax=Flavobacterium sp. CFS9 TaxID=3143118 RepID=A0AAT9H499_9FLAO
MDYLSLICSFSLFGAAFAFYKLHKLWLKDAIEKKDQYKFQINFQSFKNWMIIVMIIMIGLGYFFKAFP